jgi:two-component system, chemotaxis family, CheB/CheR fusion protein
LFIVGVGASAGGVAALRCLFRTMPPDIGAAFVVVTHIGSRRETLLTEILARDTTMPVLNASSGQRVEANHVYVLPSDAVLTISKQHLDLLPAATNQHERNPIDIFFASLAKAAGENAVGIVLSGAGSDGSLGVKAIKEEGGLTIAQGHDESGPAHSGMPSSAIATGLVDVVLPVDQIGLKLRHFFRTFEVLRAAESASAHDHQQESLSQALQDIHATLQKRIGHDFSRYKHKTLLRRIHRRMQLRQIHSVPEYAERLRQEGDEASLLFRDLLIGVTSFFRDADAFEALAANVVPRLFDGAGVSDTVRVWVPGCATGEEAYSLAILLREHMSELASPPKVQVFATDIDEPALAVARTARYPCAMLEHLSGERLKRFFRSEAASYVVNKEVRDMCIFSAHSVIRDPPFSRMDLVSCRNLLIYLKMELQDNVLPAFHYALKSGGYLFLGPAESASRHADLFSALDKKHGVFQRRSVMNQNVRIPSWFAKNHGHAPEAAKEANVRKDQRLWSQIETRVMESFAPAHIVVGTEGDIVYYSSRTGTYLEPQVGSPSRQLLAMVRKGLRLELRAALREAAETQKTVVRERVDVELDDRVQLIRLTVQPMIEPAQEPLYLVVFAELGPPISHEEAAQHRPAGAPGDVSSLEAELKETRDRLQTTIEEYETALEEVKSGNEELVSVNEELQSTNEELETSKEELQSVNEELNTVNQELASKVDELHQSNADLRNLFESTEIATVFLDRFMVIRTYTPAARSIFNLISADRGRPITDIAQRLESVDLRGDIQQVLDEGKPLERSVRSGDGDTHYLMRILPYRTVDDAMDGVLMTFVNVSEVVAAEEQRMLVAELNHRVRNMLQVVIGLAHQTLHRSADLAAFDKAFMGRMQALARAYALLSRESWRRVSISDLIANQLAAFASEGARCSVQGDAVELNSSAALALGLVVYELATNATKYGSLSVPSGRVDVSWKMQQDGQSEPTLAVHWVESGGPEVRPPTHSGFGSELLNRQLSYELKGEAAIEFHKAGVQATLNFPAKGFAFSKP